MGVLFRDLSRKRRSSQPAGRWSRPRPATLACSCNGVKYVQLYGTVDTANQVMRVGAVSEICQLRPRSVGSSPLTSRTVEQDGHAQRRRQNDAVVFTFVIRASPP